MLKDTTINIITACDNSYAQHTVVFLKSLFEKNPNSDCRIFILVPDDFIHRRSVERNLSTQCKHLEFLNVNPSGADSFKDRVVGCRVAGVKRDQNIGVFDIEIADPAVDEFQVFKFRRCRNIVAQTN